MKNAKKRLVALPVLLLVVVGIVAWNYARRDRGDTVIRLSGNMEVTSVALGFRIPGWLRERLVNEGERVEAGQLIGRLDDAELLRKVEQKRHEVAAAAAELAELEAGLRPEEIAAAAAVVEQNRARLAELEAGARPQELAAAQAAVRRAEAEAEFHDVELKRITGLVSREAATRQALDSARASAAVAEAKLEEARQSAELVREGPRREAIEQARAQLEQSRQNWELARQGARGEVIDRARARLGQAREVLALAEIELGYAQLRSPLSGTVLAEHAEAGEMVAAGAPIVSVANLSNIWLRAYLDESDLGRVKLGQKARLATDTFPGKRYDGRVSFIASEAEFTPKNVQTAKERVKLVYRVKIVADNPAGELKPGMPVDVEISEVLP